MKPRIQSCTKKLKELKLDSLLISDPININYLTGFSADNGYLLLTRDEGLIYFTNFLYRDIAKKNTCLKKPFSNKTLNWEVVISSRQDNIFNLIAKKLKTLNLKKVGFEAKHLSFLEHKALDEHLLSLSINFISTNNLIEELRVIKDSRELTCIQKSIQTSKDAFELVKEISNQAMSEKDLSIEIERFLRYKGDNELSFPSIVASGKNTAFPHHKPGNEKLITNYTLIDLGSKYYGYCADLTRMFFWGKMPPLLRKIYDIIKKAQNLSIEKIKDGVKASEIDRIAREFIDKKGWGKYFGHGLGHGIGLSVHELPLLNPVCDRILKEGMVITIEPAIYLQGKFGVRLEEMILVKSKKSEVLSGDVHR